MLCYFISTRWRTWLSYCATSRKIVSSIPGGVIGIILPAALCPEVDSASSMLQTRNADNLTTFIIRMSRNLGVAKSWKSEGLNRPCRTCRVWRNCIPKLRDVIQGNKINIYCQATMLDMRPCSVMDHQSDSE